jgi:hypothetical protein
MLICIPGVVSWEATCGFTGWGTSSSRGLADRAARSWMEHPVPSESPAHSQARRNAKRRHTTRHRPPRLPTMRRRSFCTAEVRGLTPCGSTVMKAHFHRNARGGGSQAQNRAVVGSPSLLAYRAQRKRLRENQILLTPLGHHRERNTVQHAASGRKENRLDRRHLQPPANPSNG